MVDLYRASVKRTDDYCTIEEFRHPSEEEEDQTAPVPHVETERKVNLLKLLAIFCVLLLAALISLSVYHFINLNHKEQDLEELRNLNYILTSNYSDMLEAHATLTSQYARNYSALLSLYTTLKEKNNEESKEFSNLKEFYCGVTNTTHENTCPVCKLGWVHFKSKCYFLSIDYLNWTDSRDWCKKMDGQLVNIESSDELNFLIYEADLVMDIGYQYWIGRYDIREENTNTEMDDYLVSPNRAFDDGKDCFEINLKFKVAHTRLCTNANRWICESAVFPLHI